MKGILILAGMGVLGLGTAMYFHGEAWLWAALQPENALLLANEAIPEAVSESSWEEDIQYLHRELPKRLARFDLAVDEAVFDRELDSTISSMGGNSRAEHILGLAKLSNFPMNPGYSDGHSGLPPLQQPLNWKYYPFFAYAFDDGIWVTLSAGEARKAEGGEILKLNGFPVDQVLDLGKPYISADNRYSRLDRLTAHLSFADFLAGLGIVPKDGALHLLLRRQNGDSLELDIKPSPLFSLAGLKWGQKLQQSVSGWSPADPRPRKENFHFDYLAASRTMYVQFNRVADEDNESISEFTDRLKGQVDLLDIDRFVVDLRNNGGGDNQLLEPLVSLISHHPKINRYGCLFTLIGRRTYSAAGSFAAALERRSQTLFAGEPSGFSPNHLGDAQPIVLPNSRILINVSTRYWEEGGPFDTRSWIAPDLEVPISSDDHFSGHDPVWEAILGYQKEKHPSIELFPEHLQTLRQHLPGRYRFGEFRILEISPFDFGLPRFTIHGVQTWASSSIYPLDRQGMRFSTDIDDVFLEIDVEGGLFIDWKDSIHQLPLLPPQELTPTELLRVLSPEGSVSVDSVVAMFNTRATAGFFPDSYTEFMLNRIGYQFLQKGYSGKAIQLFELQTRLFPTVANAFDSLGDGYMAAGKLELARNAFTKSLELDPGHEHSRQMLQEISAASL